MGGGDTAAPFPPNVGLLDIVFFLLFWNKGLSNKGVALARRLEALVARLVFFFFFVFLLLLFLEDDVASTNFRRCWACSVKTSPRNFKHSCNCLEYLAATCWNHWTTYSQCFRSCLRRLPYLVKSCLQKSVNSSVSCSNCWTNFEISRVGSLVCPRRRTSFCSCCVP